MLLSNHALRLRMRMSAKGVNLLSDNNHCLVRGTALYLTIMSPSTAEHTAEHVLYAERPEWSDVVPIAQYENIQPLAPIFYSPECAQCSTFTCLIVC
jgi:hypothetical protein